MRVFIAGIMQGSLTSNHVHSQDYREQIRAIVARHCPSADLFCPWELFPDSVTFGLEKARHTLISMAEEAGRCDVVVAYLPQASMGTALEMWKAYEAGRAIVSISPMHFNWVVQGLSDQIVETMEEFEAFVAGGGLERLAQKSTPGSATH